MKQIQGRFLLQSNKDFPADCEMLDYMQTNAHVVSIIGNLAGDKAILLGCALTGGGTQRSEATCSCARRNTPRARCSTGRAAPFRAACTSNKPRSRYRPRDTNIRRPTSSGRWLRASARRTTNGRTSTRRSRCPNSKRRSWRCRSPWPRFSARRWGWSKSGRIPHPRRLCSLRRQQLKQSEYPELYKAIGSTYKQCLRLQRPELSTTSGYSACPTCAPLRGGLQRQRCRLRQLRQGGRREKTHAHHR